MSDHVPAWLKKELPNAREGHANLTIARMGSADLLNKGGFSLKSAAFVNGEELDPCFTAQEEDAVAPPLEWTPPPAGAQELVLIVEDPDAPGDDALCHWVVWGLPPQKGQLLEGENPPRVGKNAQKNSEWLLPNPPAEDGPHDYVFQLFAIDLPLVLMPGASRAQLHKEMEGRIVAAAILTGTYQHQDDSEEVWEDDDDAL
ncbi:YbhB/YbcL family Raf kinase inhibitor-like protein [Altericroceibacterium endophyticum]|uniref:YbhB/YbcL family Raf kinase inhibitor-like protein n=1 Tax=Altericroceibacterium endophyticum TaxID=1808508 RepID=A0A6I4T997_9SPHN|nr:YbhB/YbcL family Raf kinase inhibitor-like protein [Altericroceibacterium endophyticum]MXO66969.1 YbhB/YbcL family Raf kinase inhibitor-like protein [Altericroceibacterium endophyticum]